MLIKKDYVVVAMYVFLIGIGLLNVNYIMSNDNREIIIQEIEVPVVEFTYNMTDIYDEILYYEFEIDVTFVDNSSYYLYYNGTYLPRTDTYIVIDNNITHRVIFLFIHETLNNKKIDNINKLNLSIKFKENSVFNDLDNKLDYYPINDYYVQIIIVLT